MLNFTLRYVLALSAIALLSIAGVVLSSTQVERLRGSAEIINVAGRQRMLSQRIAFLLHTPKTPARDQLIEESLARFVQAGRWLEAQADDGHTSEVDVKAKSLEVTYASEVRTALAENAPSLTAIEALAKDRLLPALEARVTAYQERAEGGLAQVVVLERLLLVLVLTLLVLEALLVFRPLARRLAEAIGSLKTELQRKQEREVRVAALLAASGDGAVTLDALGRCVKAPSPILLNWFPRCAEGVFFQSVGSSAMNAPAIEALSRFERNEITEDQLQSQLPHFIENQDRLFAATYQVQNTSPLRLLVVMRDMSELKRRLEAERRRTEAEERARRAMSDRLSALGTVAAGIAHQVNNPSAWIRANTEFAIRTLRTGGDPKLLPVIDALEETRDGVDRITRIVQDMSAMVQPADALGTSTQTEATIDLVIRLARSEWPHCTIETSLMQKPNVAISDGRLGSILSTLLDNAAEAMPTDRVSSLNRIFLRGKVVGHCFVLEVVDNGRGIPDEDQAKLFTPFHTAKHGAQGTGLSLALAHAMVSSVGGSLTFTSKPSETIFRVELPIAPPSSPEVTANSA